jgi:Kdo2-lipid IVA lauroyltransferase/acyltransferase
MSKILLTAWFWLLHWLPFPLIRLKGAMLGELLFWLVGRRRNIGLRNLQLCFPDWTEAERRRVLRRHFREMASGLLGYGILIFGSQRRLEKLIRREGLEHYTAAAAQGPVIMLAPHFLGLDYGGIRHTIDYGGASMYSAQRIGAFDSLLLRARSRFNNPRLIARHEGIRPCVRALKDGINFYYLPDQDLGPRESIFAPFFGIPTATVPALSRLAQLGRARVVPMVAEMGWFGFTLRYYPVWENFPGESVEEDTARMNAFIEDRIREMPSQYYWLHRRFKTRPEGEASLY